MESEQFCNKKYLSIIQYCHHGKAKLDWYV